MSTWFITGASRGFGRSLTAAALQAGHAVVAAARNPEDVATAFPDAGDALLPVRLDVTDPAQATTAADAAVDRFGSIDVLVNNAGYGLFGSIEETPDADVRALFDTNVFGLLNVTRAVLPVMRRQRTGRILNMSSSAGFAVGAGRGLYGASKFAVEAISEALHGEVGPLGIKVTVVEPGSFRTDFLSPGSRRATHIEIDDYRSTVGALLTGIETNNGKQPGDPERLVAAVLHLTEEPDPPLRLQLGTDSVRLVENKLRLVREELDRWHHLSLSTDFPTEDA